MPAGPGTERDGAAKNDATGVETTTKSAATGEYHLANLPAGTYTLTVTATGFTKAQLQAPWT